jgi:hypothetical protein
VLHGDDIVVTAGLGGGTFASRRTHARSEADLLGDSRAECVGYLLHAFDAHAGVVGRLPPLDLLLGRARSSTETIAIAPQDSPLATYPFPANLTELCGDDH